MSKTTTLKLGATLVTLLLATALTGCFEQEKREPPRNPYLDLMHPCTEAKTGLREEHVIKQYDTEELQAARFQMGWTLVDSKLLAAHGASADILSLTFECNPKPRDYSAVAHEVASQMTSNQTANSTTTLANSSVRE